MATPVFEIPANAFSTFFPRIVFNPSKSDLLLFTTHHLHSGDVSNDLNFDGDIGIIGCQIGKSFNRFSDLTRGCLWSRDFHTGLFLKMFNHATKGLFWWDEELIFVAGEFFRYRTFICIGYGFFDRTNFIFKLF